MSWPIQQTSHLQRGDVDPAPLFPALGRRFDKLKPLRAFEQRVLERRIFIELSDEHLPLDLEAVVVIAGARHLLPRLEKFDRLRDVRIPNRPWRVHPRLAPAVL